MDTEILRYSINLKKPVAKIYLYHKLK